MLQFVIFFLGLAILYIFTALLIVLLKTTKMAKYIEQENNTINLIGVGTDINGDIESSGDIRFDGTLKGNLKTKGKVVIGATGIIKGEVSCKNSDVEGKVEGTDVSKDGPDAWMALAPPEGGAAGVSDRLDT